MEPEPTVDGKRAVIGFALTAVAGFLANYVGDSTGHHAARGAVFGIVAVVIGLSLSWWFSRTRAEP